MKKPTMMSSLIVAVCGIVLMICVVIGGTALVLCWRMTGRVLSVVETGAPNLLRQAQFLRYLALGTPLFFSWLMWSIIFNKLCRPIHHNLVYRMCLWLQEQGFIRNHWGLYRRVAKTVRAIARVG